MRCGADSAWCQIYALAATRVYEVPSDINSLSQRLTSVAAMEGTDGEETRESDNAAV